ncbi:hypothetical protein V8C86DRAFT_2481611 [Haematococcus lacustris]
MEPSAMFAVLRTFDSSVHSLLKSPPPPGSIKFMRRSVRVVVNACDLAASGVSLYFLQSAFHWSNGASSTWLTLHPQAPGQTSTPEISSAWNTPEQRRLRTPLSMAAILGCAHHKALHCATAALLPAVMRYSSTTAASTGATAIANEGTLRGSGKKESSKAGKGGPAVVKTTTPGQAAGKARGGSPGSSSSSSDLQEQGLLAEPWEHRPSRFTSFAQQVLYREMLLKLGRPQQWNHVPRIARVILTISAQHDLRMAQLEVDKKELFLGQLALEHLAGGAQVVFDPHRKGRDKARAEAVSCCLEGQQGLDFLEKLVNVVLPNQMGFEGLAPAQLLGSDEAVEWPMAKPPARLAAHITRARRAKEQTKFAVDIRVDNMLLFPDFASNFELFEPLRSMQVRIIVVNAENAHAASSCVAAFGLPLLPSASA